jgi:3-oxoacyl-[acyl-carrier-protein] synthase II
MKTFIRATGNISPQNTFGHPAFLIEPLWQAGNRLTCMEPDYRNFIDTKLIRRMSRIIKIGVGAAHDCLQEAGVQIPGAIITGTAYGCLEDTGTFLSKMVSQHEEMLSPTAFIQSTHNTVGAQIALALQCHHYNNTFVHRGFSFESALIDSIMLLEENEAPDVLVGGLDEITDTSHRILSRMGLYKQSPQAGNALFSAGSKGSIAGEGAAFFLLTKEHSSDDYAELSALSTFYKPASQQESAQRVRSFLAERNLAPTDIDLLITGKNGDAQGDAIYDHLHESVFTGRPTVPYKHLCGEYPTAVSFALWLAAHIIKLNTVPLALGNIPANQNRLKRVLIYNHYQNIHHSIMLVSAC